MIATVGKEKHYWPLLAVAFIVVAAVMALGGSTNIGANAVGSFLGHGIGLALLPLLVMRFLSNRAGWITLVVLTLGYSQGALNWLGEQRSAVTSQASHRHAAKDCEFSVEFPDRPTIKVYTLPGVGDYEEALWTSQVPEDSTVLRTECVNIPNISEKLTDLNAKQFLLNQLSTFATNNGLSSVEYRYALEEIGPTGIARGTKLVQKIPVTYQIMIVGGRESLITLVAGGKSTTFPQREVSPFFASLQRVE